MDDKQRIMELEHEVFMLQEQLGSYRASPEWGLTPTQAVIFEALSFNKYASTETLRIALELELGLSPTGNTIKTQVSKMRTRMRKRGAPYTIVNRHGWGWRVERLQNGKD